MMKELWVAALVISLLAADAAPAQVPVEHPPLPAGLENLAEAAAAVLARQCYSCHNDTKREGGLSLQTLDALLLGGRSGPAVVPGRSDESRVVLMMEGFLEPMMPEDGFMIDEEIDVIRRWIDAGASAWRGDLARLRLEDLPEIQPRVPVEAPIASLAFSPAGGLLAAGSYSQVRLLQPGVGRLLGRLEGHVETVRSLAFSPDGSLLAAAGGVPSRYGEIQLWRVGDGSLVRSLEGHNDCVYSVAFSPDGRRLATSSYDRLVKLWDVDSGREIRTFKGHVDAVYAVEFSADGRHLLSASADRTVKVWDLQSGDQAFGPMAESTGELYTLAFHPESRMVAAGGADKMIRVWQLGESGGRLIRSAFAHDSPILRLVFTPDGTTLISSGADRLVKFWDIETLQEQKVLNRQPDWVLSLAVSPDGQWLAAGRYDGAVDWFPVKSHETR